MLSELPIRGEKVETLLLHTADLIFNAAAFVFDLNLSINTGEIARRTSFTILETLILFSARAAYRFLASCEDDNQGS